MMHDATRKPATTYATGSDTVPSVSPPSRRSNGLEEIREKFSHAQVLFDEYRAARATQTREAELAWAKVVHDAAVALGHGPAPLDPNPAAVSHPSHQAPAPAPVGAALAPQSPALEMLAAPPPASPIATPPARGPARYRQPYAAVLMIAILASSAAVGVARMKMRGTSSQDRTDALSGTAFEGTMTPANQFTIAAPLSTVVHRILVTVGDRVAAGQPLLVADDREARATVESAQLDLRTAEAGVGDGRRRLALLESAPVVDFARASGRLSEAQRETEQVPTRQWRDSPERAEAAHEQSRLKVDRTRKLFEQGLISRQEMEDADISLRVAANDLENARKAAVAVATLKSAQRHQSDLQWQVARAEQAQHRAAQRAALALAELRRDDAALKLKAAQDRLNGVTIKAQSAGVVTELLAHPGDQVYGGAPLIKLAVLDTMLVDVQIGPSLVDALRPGQAATVTLPGIPVRHTQGTVAAVNPMPNANGNHTVQVRFDNRSGQLLAGQPAEVRFVLK